MNNNNMQQQDLSRGKISESNLSKRKLILYRIGRKRRNSEDEDMIECSSIHKQQQRRLSKCIKSSELKRHKSSVQKRSIRGALLGT